MVKATYKKKVIAESDKTIIVEGNHYFPPESVKKNYFSKSEHSTICSWKGTASYYNINMDDESASNAAWYYPKPLDKAKEIKDYVAFWGKDVQIISN